MQKIKKKDLPIVVIGQNYSTSYGVIRALGEAGYRVEVGKRFKYNPSKYVTPELKSKYVEKYCYLLTRDDEYMVDKLISHFSLNDKKKILIPTDDYCTALIDRNLDIISKYFIVPNAKGAKNEVVRLMDKYYQKKKVSQYDIKTVETCVVNCASDNALIVPDEIAFPCIVKPLVSAGVSKSYIKKCENRLELIQLLQEVSKSVGCKMLIEHYLDIEKEYTIPGIAINEDVIIPGILKKTRMGDGSHKGVTICGEVVSTDVCPVIIDNLKKFVKETGFQGIFDIELLYSKGIYYFNELNLRYGAAGYAITKSGINLPAMYVDYINNIETDYKNYRNKLNIGKSFVNEKAAFENFLAEFSSFSDYLSTIIKSNIRFLLSTSDYKVSISFVHLMIIQILGKFKMKWL